MSEPAPAFGVNHDEGKAPIHLIPPELVLAVAHVLGNGTKKYDARNWENGMSWGRVFSSLMRHLWKWWGGETDDQESGLPHLWHAAARVAMLVAYESRKVGIDDRHPSW